MKGIKTVVLMLSLCVLATACSKESRLVGVWETSTPESIQLRITKTPAFDPSFGFYDGYSWKEGGQEYHLYWRLVPNMEDRLQLSPGPGIGPTGESMTWNSRTVTVTNLTSDKLVLDWSGVKQGGGPYEFHRSK